jgi:putative transposase
VVRMLRICDGLKELDSENARLKKMYADLSLTHHALQDVIQKKL